VKPLTAADRAEIERDIREKILHTGRHPAITFRSTGIAGEPAAFRVDGELGIAGVTRPVTIEAGLAGDRVRGSATIVQSQWGIRPYSAFFGALKLRDEVGVEFDAGLVASP
jgi:polyisoprenoid-binding protein YceI